jgi:hypothetical protein
LTGDQRHRNDIETGQLLNRHADRPYFFYFFPTAHFLKNNFSQPHGQAHLVFSNAQANAKKPKELAPSHPRQYSGHLHYLSGSFYYI